MKQLTMDTCQPYSKPQHCVVDDVERDQRGNHNAGVIWISNDGRRSALLYCYGHWDLDRLPCIGGRIHLSDSVAWLLESAPVLLCCHVVRYLARFHFQDYRLSP